MAGTYNRNTYNSALYNAGRDDAGAIIKSIIQAHTGPHIQAVAGADPRLPANQSGISFISDFNIIEGVVRRPPIAYNFPDLKAVMRVMQTGQKDLPALIYAQRYLDMPACVFPVAFLPDLQAYIFGYAEIDLGAEIFGELAKLDLAAIIQIVQEDLGGFIFGLEAPSLGGRVFSQASPTLGAIIWSPTDLPASIGAVLFSDLPADIFAYSYGDMPAKMLGLAAPKLFAQIKGFASATLDMPSVLYSRLEELLGATVTAAFPGPNDFIATVSGIGSGHGSLSGYVTPGIPGDRDLIATIGREYGVTTDLEATLNFLSAVTINASISAWPLGVNDKFLSGLLQPLHPVDIPASISSNDNLKNLAASIQALAGYADLPAFIRAAETFVTAILTVSTMNAADLRATIGRPDCEGGSATKVLSAYAKAQTAQNLGGSIQSFIESDLSATINLKEIFYAMDSIGVTFSPRADRPTMFLTTDTIGVTFSPFRGLNLGAYIKAGQPNIDISASITAIRLLPRVEPAVGVIDAKELRPDRDFDTQEIRLQLEGELLDYFYANGTSDAFISDGSKDWKINIRSFREIAAGLFGDFAAGRVCRLGGLTSYASLDEAIRDCITAVIGQQGESDMTASLLARGGVATLDAVLIPHRTFGDMSALVNRVFPIDFPASISGTEYPREELNAFIFPQSVGVQASLPGYISGYEVNSLSASTISTGGYGDLYGSIPKVWKKGDLASLLAVFTNNVSMDFPSGDCYFATTTGDNGVPVSGTGDFTVMCVARSGSTGFDICVGAWNSAQTGSDEPSFRLKKNSSTFSNLTNSAVTNDSGTSYFINHNASTDTSGTTWYNWVVTYNSSTGSIRAYQDGVFNAETFATGTRKEWSEFTIGAGRFEDLIVDQWFAEIDTVAVWDTVLSDADISTIYNANLGETNLELAPGSSNLQAWYRLGESGDTLTTLQDRSGNGHDMVRIGSATNIIVANVPN